MAQDFSWHASARRYVELGSHYGCSFFAACQAVRRFGTDAECVAIDTWWTVSLNLLNLGRLF